MSQVPTKTQVSAGGVAFRRRGRRVEVALISVGDAPRWQLPKGLIARGEAEGEAAMREVREEAGVETELLGLIERIEYWYYSTERGRRVRFHKYVYFYLLRYKSGDVSQHDDEVTEARWVAIEEAREMLTFSTEKRVVERAREMVLTLDA